MKRGTRISLFSMMGMGCPGHNLRKLRGRIHDQAVQFLLVMFPLCLLALSSTARADDQRGDGEFYQIDGPSGDNSELIYVNGLNTEGDGAIREARQLGKRLKLGVTLCYNDCSQWGDPLEMSMDKLGDFDWGVSEAAAALYPRVKHEVEQGHRIGLIGYSLGTTVVMNVVNKLADDWADQSDGGTERLHLIHVLLVGPAVFGPDHALSNGFPEALGSLFFISDARDPVARGFGNVDDEFVGADWKAHRFIENYLRHIDLDRLNQTGRLVTRGADVLLEEIYQASDPSQREVRWRVFAMKDQESRRTLNGHIPAGWHHIRWTVQGCPDADAIRFTPMDDVSFWGDEAVEEPVYNGVVGPNEHPDYLGRIRMIRNGQVVRGPELWQAVHGGFWVEARPAETFKRTVLQGRN